MSKRIACPICGNNEVERLFEKQGCTFVQCLTDELVYIDPQPDREELQEVYDRYGEEFFVLPESIAASGDYPDYRRRFIDFRQTNRLLEIGTAAGAFLIRCRKDGWDTYGVELSAPSSRLAREQHGLNVITGTIHDGGYENDFFDVVVAWQTLEHVTNPREVIKEVWRILRPKGLFVLSVPCWKGISIRLLRKKYRYVGRDHLFYFSPKNMKLMLSDVGFSKIYTRTAGFNPIVFYKDIKRHMGNHEQNYTAENRMVEHVITGIRQDRFLKGIHRIYSEMITKLNIGDTLFAEALKE